jgi:hypothetical protein
MSEKRKGGRFYLAAVFGKAWQEVSFIEVLSEAIGGFVFGVIALLKGWLDFRGAFETALECAGCAILIPFIAFILRVCFSAPAELVKESSESKKKEEINPKSIYPSIVVMLLALCSFLVIGLAFSLKVNFIQLKEKPSVIQAVKKEPQKPLPTKTIPRPEPAPPPMIVITQQLADAETQKQFETFNLNTGDVEDTNIPAIISEIAKLKAEQVAKIAKLKAENDAKIGSEKRKRDLNIQHWWDVYLPHFKHSLTVLHDALADEARKTGDGITQSVDYFQCLPPTIDSKIGELKVAEIGLQKNTNMDFIVSITALTGSDVRYLRISCGGCFLESWLSWGEKFIRDIHIDPDFDNEKEVPIEKANELIDEEMKELIAARYYVLSNTNKENLKLPQNK